ncbi:MAG: class I SAM-dependent methyltransferase [Nannocystaceae bacterium]|nr:class I SAM-dependent methyltransferase [Nannocystaceae bacterium]
MEAPKGRVDYDAVRHYFDRAGKDVSAAASYMAHGQDLPVHAMRYRFDSELRTLSGWLDRIPKSAAVLDIGCGAGAWTSVFAARYASVVGIEGSASMVAAARRHTHGLPNVRIIEGDARTDIPENELQLAFLGGLCMYLNDDDVVSVLTQLKDRLSDGAPIILRESTVPGHQVRSTGEYQAVYRTVSDYHRLFRRAGCSSIDTRRNYGYTSMEMAIELVGLRRRRLPFLPQRSAALGAMTWWGLRLTSPISFMLAPRVLDRLDVAWPALQNHFFHITADR